MQIVLQKLLTIVKIKVSDRFPENWPCCIRVEFIFLFDILFSSVRFFYQKRDKKFNKTLGALHSNAPVLVEMRGIEPLSGKGIPLAIAISCCICVAYFSMFFVEPRWPDQRPG